MPVRKINGIPFFKGTAEEFGEMPAEEIQRAFESTGMPRLDGEQERKKFEDFRAQLSSLLKPTLNRGYAWPPFEPRYMESFAVLPTPYGHVGFKITRTNSEKSPYIVVPYRVIHGVTESKQIDPFEALKQITKNGFEGTQAPNVIVKRRSETFADHSQLPRTRNIAYSLEFKPTALANRASGGTRKWPQNIGFVEHARPNEIQIGVHLPRGLSPPQLKDAINFHQQQLKGVQLKFFQTGWSGQAFPITPKRMVEIMKS